MNFKKEAWTDLDLRLINKLIEICGREFNLIFSEAKDMGLFKILLICI